MNNLIEMNLIGLDERVAIGGNLAWAIFGFLLGSVGGLGVELIDGFAGRSLEVYCRVRKNRDRFGAVLDHQDDAIRGSEYLRMIGTVLFLLFGTVVVVNRLGQSWDVLLLWAVGAGLLMMLTHLWLPVAITRFISSPLLYHTWPFWFLLSIAMRPLQGPGELLEIMTRRLAGKTEHEDEDEEQLEDEIRTIVTAGTREGYFGPGVREMIQGVMELHEDTVGHIMTPRGNVEAIDAKTTWPDAIHKIIASGRTRYPVYQDSLDNVVGILFVKDLLPFLVSQDLPNQPILELCRRPWAVPKGRSVELILREFLHNRSHMAIVVDEFQQTAGVVTIEDVLEEIVGEIVDESDEEEEYAIQIIDDDTIEVDGRVMIDDLNELIHWELPESDDYETIAGWVLYHTGSIPDPGQRFTLNDFEIHILRATNRKIESMRLRRGPEIETGVGER